MATTSDGTFVNDLPLHLSLTAWYADRDELVSWAVGTTSFNDVTYSTTAENITGLLPVGTAGVNHSASPPLF